METFYNARNTRLVGSKFKKKQVIPTKTEWFIVFRRQGKEMHKFCKELHIPLCIIISDPKKNGEINYV